MILSELFPHSVVMGDPSTRIKRAVQDSRIVEPGDLFCAVKGASFDGREYIEQAVQQGAVAIVSDFEGCAKATSLGVASVMFDAPGAVMGDVASRLYGKPSRKLWMTGITGTNGKSSTAWWLGECLATTEPTAVLGTIGKRVVGKEVTTSTHTTQDAARLQWDLSCYVEQGIKNVAMEVSSHALDQGRVNGIEFDVGIYTNLSRDHLDYHGSMEAYAEAKRKLLCWPRLSTAVINLDDTVGTALASSSTADNILTYSLNNQAASIYASNIELTPAGINAQLHHAGESVALAVKLFGRFNLSNLLAVAGALIAKGYSLPQIADCFNKLNAVPGRMDHVVRADNKQVLVDYAHTPDALQSALAACREHVPTGKLYVVFGCGGDRDTGKRAMMMQAAESGADVVVITSDNPRTEDPAAIIDQALAGAENKDAVIREDDRRAAIEKAISMMGADDLLLIAGKGHETYQEINGERFDFDDRKVAAEVAQ